MGDPDGPGVANADFVLYVSTKTSWVLYTPYKYDCLCRKLCKRADARSVSVNINCYSNILAMADTTVIVAQASINADIF